MNAAPPLTATNYAVEFVHCTGVSTSGVHWVKPRPGKATFIITVSPLPDEHLRVFVYATKLISPLRS